MKIILKVLLMSILASSCVRNKKDIMVIGHRGARGHVAENTIASIKKAMELGVDGIEIDVFRCSTGELVVFHDKTIDELTDGSGYIEQMSLDSLKQFQVLGKEPIPTLNEVMDLIDGKVMLNIELKGTQTAVLTSELISSYMESSNWKSEYIFISSFDWNELEQFRTINKNITIAVLTEDDPLDAIPVASSLSAVAINPDFKSLNSRNIEAIHKAGFKIYPWTINEIEDIDEMIRLGVDAIITDFPERVKR
ncbi:MAG: glycerophosphodiester phosphodiesterase family protein [Flavobacteriaceae bacterium]|nr:glycerophosphodiester phosphodiesterase family protein [Flavobacteriaceae bacterium]